MGFLSVSVREPTLVKSLKAIIVKKIQCGDNYSACITSDRKLLVTGEIDGGKLGIGKSWITGCILSFKEVPTLQNVGKVACGPNHMLAILKDSKDTTSKKTSVFAWGRNWRGQLGLGNKDDSLFPKEIKAAKELKFNKICCGRDFSIALSKINKSIYVWGNYRFLCNTQVDEDLKLPTIMATQL